MARLALLFVLVGALGAQTPGPKEEERYKNKPVSFWIARLQDKDAAARKEAVHALTTIGPGAVSAVSALLKVLEEDDDTAVRTQALDALGHIGPGAQAAVPVLLRILDDKDYQFRIKSLTALGKVMPEDPRAIGVLVQRMLTGKTGDEQGQAGQALLQMGPKAKAALPLFREALRDETLRGRHQAIVVISGAIGPAAADILAGAVQDRDSAIRGYAVEGLKKLGSAAETVLPTVKKALGDPDAGVRMSALAAVTALDPEPVPVLTRFLVEDDEPTVRRYAADSLGSLGTKAKVAIPVLVAALADRGVSVQAGKALANIGPDAVDPLVASLTDPALRVPALAALAELGPKAKGAVPALVPLLRDKGGEPIRVPVRTALVKIGEEAVPALAATLTEKDPDQACQVLGAIGAKAKPAVPAIALLLKDPMPQMRIRAAVTLAQIGPAARSTVPALTDALKDENADVRKQVETALTRIQGG
jgi:HEAT repeat protein